MGLIQELTRYLEQANDIKSYNDEIARLENKNAELKNKLCEMEEDRDFAIESKEWALDEICILQKRVDSLLRQLKDKNGGN